MKHHFLPSVVRIVVLLPLLFCTAVALRSEDNSRNAARILLVTQSMGYRHLVTTRTGAQLSLVERAMTQLGVDSGVFCVDCTQDVAKDFTKQKLDGYDVVVFYTVGDLPIPEEVLDYFLNDWLKCKGHGFLGIHGASNTFADYKPYWKMLGGKFESHPWLYTDTVTVTVHDPNHPVTKPWGSEFTITDEIFRIKGWQPEEARVLMSLNMAKTAKKAPYHVPVAWVKRYGEGRVVYMGLGHRNDVWTNRRYLQSLLGGILWILSQEQGDATPNPNVSRLLESQSKAACEVASPK